MDVVKIEKLKSLKIGIQNENDATQVKIDMTSWVEEYPERYLTCFVIFRRPDDYAALPAESTYDSVSHILTWNVTQTVTSKPGMGFAEIRAMSYPDDGLIKKSSMIPTLVENSVTGATDTTVPAPYEDWVNLVLDTKNQLNNIFATAAHHYQISEDGSNVPTGEWVESYTSRQLEENRGKYLWTRTTLTWETHTATEPNSYIYSIAYLGMDAAGQVTKINGKSGNVVLDGDDINVDDNAETPEKIKNAVNRIDSLSSESAGRLDRIEGLGYAIRTKTITMTKADAEKQIYAAHSTGSNKFMYLRHGYFTAPASALGDVSPSDIISTQVLTGYSQAAFGPPEYGEYINMYYVFMGYHETGSYTPVPETPDSIDVRIAYIVDLTPAEEE